MTQTAACMVKLCFPWLPELTDGVFFSSCIFLSGNGVFFVNYVITAALIGSALELIRFSDLFMFAVRLMAARSSAEKTAVRKVSLLKKRSIHCGIIVLSRFKSPTEDQYSVELISHNWFYYPNSWDLCDEQVKDAIKVSVLCIIGEISGMILQWIWNLMLGPFE